MPPSASARPAPGRNRRIPPPRRGAVVAAALLAGAPAAGAQTLDDGFVLPARVGRLTVDYGAERWDEYWEGTRLRTNGNIGTLVTRTVTVTGGFGVTGRLSVFASLPTSRPAPPRGCSRDSAAGRT